MAERPRSAEHVFVGTGRPEARPRMERPELTPAEAARMQLFRDVFEVGRQSYEKERMDGQRTQEGIAIRAVDVLNDVLDQPLNYPRHVQNVDAWVRQKLGLTAKRVPLAVRAERIFGNAALGALAAGIDMLDLRLHDRKPGDSDEPFLKDLWSRVEPHRFDQLHTHSLASEMVERGGSAAKDAGMASAAKLWQGLEKRREKSRAAGWGADQLMKLSVRAVQRGAQTDRPRGKREESRWFGGAYRAGLEYIVDKAISAGADKTVQVLTKSRARYASPLAHRIYNISRLVPLTDAFLNPTLIESVFRTAGNWPVWGAPIEAVYRHFNDQLRQQTPAAEFAEGLAYSMMRGQMDYNRMLDHEKRTLEGEQRREEAMERGQRIAQELADLRQGLGVTLANTNALAEAMQQTYESDGEPPKWFQETVARMRTERKKQQEAAARDADAPPAEGEPKA